VTGVPTKQMDGHDRSASEHANQEKFQRRDDRWRRKTKCGYEDHNEQDHEGDAITDPVRRRAPRRWLASAERMCRGAGALSTLLILTDNDYYERRGRRRRTRMCPVRAR